MIFITKILEFYRNIISFLRVTTLLNKLLFFFRCKELKDLILFLIKQLLY